MNYKNKNVLVYGLGASGKAAAKLLLSHGARVSVYDDKGFEGLPTGVTAVSDLKRAVDFADEVVLSPAVNPRLPVLAQALKSKKVIGELELAYGFLNSELIAVSGTNGKTTVTLMINEIINGAGYISYALGNVGIPLSERVDEMTPSQTAVVEVSSFQLETCKEFSPDIAVLTNVTSDHIDRHGSIENYAAVKSRLFENQINRDFAVLNADDITSMEIAEKVKSDKFFFSKDKKVRGCYVENGELYFEDTGKIRICAKDEIGAKGTFNLENALAASTACILKGINPEIIRHTLKSFRPPEFRLAYLGEKRGKKFYNDSKGTNVAATLSAADSLEGKTVLIVGGRGKGENYGDLFEKLSENVIHIFVTGENSPEIVEAALQYGYYGISHRATLGECINEASCVKADNVLFSPASASFDRYADYRERGRVFDALFAELK